MAKAYRQRPSSFLDIADSYAAFCFDEACFDWGSYVDYKLDSVDGKTESEIRSKRERAFNKLMGIPLRYADPAAILGDKKSYTKRI